MGSNARHRIAPFSIDPVECFAFHNSAFCDAVCYHELTNFFGMSPTDDDVVVTDGMLEQIRLQVHLKCDLRAAEMIAVRRFDGLCFGDKVTVKFWATPFK